MRSSYKYIKNKMCDLSVKWKNIKDLRRTVLSYGPILGKVHWMTSNDIDMFKLKNTNMHATYTPDAQFFVCFVPRWAVELWPTFRKSALYDRFSAWHLCVRQPTGLLGVSIMIRVIRFCSPVAELSRWLGTQKLSGIDRSARSN